jgi:phage N-6-adenine-methyltransferase
MSRIRVYSTNAEKQAAYRQRKKGHAVQLSLWIQKRMTPAEKQRAYRQREAQRRAKRKPQVYHLSQTVEWETPQSFFDALHAEFHFTLDVAAQAGNAKCACYFTPQDDGLTQLWEGVCWMNPPYGKTIGQWVAKAAESAQHGAVVVCLLPVRTDTKWWQRYCLPPTEVRFVPGRLTFGGASNPAPFPNAVVIFRPPCRQERPLEDQPLCTSLALTPA